MKKLRIAALFVMLLAIQQPIFAEKPLQKKKIENAKRKVLYAQGDDGDEKIASAAQNYKTALQMLQKAIEMGHVVQDKNGLYVKKCDSDCTCLPVVPSAK